MMQHMITTVDNPYDPFTEFDKWYTWDTSKGYHSSAYLARVVVSSEALSEADQMMDIEKAIDEIVLLDPLDVYSKVSKDVQIVTRPSELLGMSDTSDS